MRDLFGTPTIPAIDRSVGQSNGRFLGYVANGMSRADLVKRWKDGEFDGLNPEIAKQAMAFAGLSTPTLNPTTAKNALSGGGA